MDSVVKAIREIQEAGRLKDQEIADAVDVHLVTWRRIKHGRRYGRKFLDGAKRAFPGIFLPCGDSEAVINPGNTPQPSPAAKRSPLTFIRDLIGGKR
jgi:hypothetical protein